MKRRHLIMMLASLIAFLMVTDISAQRRSRPGSVKHTEQEAIEIMKKTKVNGKYIRDGSTFRGDIYLTGDAGAIKIGTATITFSKGEYKLSFRNAKFKVQDDKYKNRMRWQKIGEDFSYGGEYEVMEQLDKTWLILYESTAANETSDNFLLESKDAKTIELDVDGMYMKLDYVGH